MKKVLEKLNRFIGFTPNEGKIVGVLVGAFLVGGVLKLFGVSNSPDQPFDYSASDSLFFEKSKHLQQPAMNKETPANSATDSLSTLLININTATKEQLMTLPSIGEATAEQILLYREENGELTTLNELLQVEGIGEKKLERLKPFITLKK